MNPVYYVLAVWNLAVLAMYGIDKWKSAHDKLRIRERTLILSAFLMGSLGAIVGMNLFRHKTKHMKFIVLLPIALLVNVALVLAVFYLSAGA